MRSMPSAIGMQGRDYRGPSPILRRAAARTFRAPRGTRLRPHATSMPGCPGIRMPAYIQAMKPMVRTRSLLKNPPRTTSAMRRSLAWPGMSRNRRSVARDAPGMRSP